MNKLTCFDVSIENGIAHISMNRPDQLNSMIRVFWKELPDLIKEIDKTYTNYNLANSITGSLNNLMENNSIRFRNPKNKIQWSLQELYILKSDHHNHNNFHLQLQENQFLVLGFYQYKYYRNHIHTNCHL